MFEPKTKTITRWGLTIQGSDVYFPKKETAIKIGRLTIKMNPETQMFEEYRLWDLTSSVPQLIDEQRFDRTILIQNKSDMNQFKIGEWAKFRNEFQRLLPDFPMIDLHDALLSMINEHITIDIIALGERLKKMYPDDWECMSIKDIIIKHYGFDAMQLIESVL